MLTIDVLRQAHEVPLLLGQLNQGVVSRVRIRLHGHVLPPGVEEPHERGVGGKGLGRGQRGGLVVAPEAAGARKVGRPEAADSPAPRTARMRSLLLTSSRNSAIEVRGAIASFRFVSFLVRIPSAVSVSAMGGERGGFSGYGNAGKVGCETARRPSLHQGLGLQSIIS